MISMRTLAQTTGMRAMDGTPLALESVALRGDVSGVRFVAHLVQRFRNPAESHIEVVYTFPMPWGAVLLGIEVDLGDKSLSGVVVERRYVEAAYEDAIADGDTAIMIERNADGSYTLNLANLAPQEVCTIRIHYAQTLLFDPTGLRLVIPTVVAPRYGDSMRQTGLRPHQVVEHDACVRYPFTLAISLGGEFALAKIASPSHLVTMQLEADGAVKVSLVREGALDRDFVLTLSELAQPSLGLVAPDTVRAGTSAVLASFCPKLHRSDKQPGPVTVKLLVDCSGSMVGDSIEAARRALGAIVDSLNEGDHFSLACFGNHVYHRSRNMWRATNATRLIARRWIESLDADMGGTEMASALAEVFVHGGNDNEQPIDVLMITDGDIHAMHSTIAIARDSGHRIFVVAIGASPSGYFLRRLAEETGGACDFVNAGEAVQAAIERMFSRLRSPRRFNLALRWPAGAAPEWVSPISAAIFDGDTVTVHAWVQGRLDGEVSLVGSVLPSGIPEVLASASLTYSAKDDALPRLVAAVRLSQLEAKGRGQAYVSHDERQQLALNYQLVGGDTNFLLIHRRAADEKAQVMPELIKVKSMIPSGYGGFGSVQNERRCESGEDVHDLPAVLRYDRPSLHSRFVEIPYELLRIKDRGISPREFLVLLNGLPRSVWPRSLAALRALNLPEALIMWIQNKGTPGTEEEVLVLDFIDALCSASLWNQWRYKPSRKGSLATYEPNPAAHTYARASMEATLAAGSIEDWPELR